MKERLLLAAIALAVLLTSCARPATSPTPTATLTPPVKPTAPTPEVTPTARPEPTASPTAAAGPAAAVPLVPFVSQGCGVRSVAPGGWTRYVADELYRGEWPADLASLRYNCYPGKSSAWAMSAVVMPVLSLEDVPESAGTLDSGGWTWQLYSIETTVPDVGTLLADVALGESAWGVRLIGLTASQDDHDLLHEAVFLPAVTSAEPVSYRRRDGLMAAELMAAEYQGDSPVNNVCFQPMGEAVPALHRLEGTLTVPEFEMADALPPWVNVPASWRYFPGFSVAFFTYDDSIVPAARGIVPSSGDRSSWRLILSPGKVWSEPDDGGMSRASFPFVLVAEDSPDAHNGIATFLYDDAHVSSFALQVVQETAPWNRTDFWGQSRMDYVPGALENSESLVARFEEELRRQTPVRPWRDLEATYDSEWLDIFTDDLEPADISTTGLVLDGTIYLQPCFTRYGEFPYCTQMRHASFSVAKSVGAAIAMLRLAETYGEQVFDLRIADYVSITAEHDGWDEVTFADALNMATGVGDNRDLRHFTADEDEPRFSEFLAARSAQDKLDVCFSYGNYPWGPGEVARYNSMNTFVLSVAMDTFLKSMEGPEADVWDMVLGEVYAPIGIFHAPIMRTFEPDGGRGVPIFGYGLYPTPDDVAKVALLLQNGGEHEGEQLLHAGRLAEALYRTDAVGLPTGERNECGAATYNLSFWSMPYCTAGGESFLIPYMTGFGGNHVAVMPNGVTAFRFADAHVYGIASMVTTAYSILPFTASGQD